MSDIQPRSPLPTSEMTKPSDSFEHDYLTARATLARLYALPEDKSIFVDNKPFAARAEMTELMVKALVQKDLQYHLYLEHGSHDKRQDVEIRHRAGETLQIDNGMRFYTVPHAAFGSGLGSERR